MLLPARPGVRAMLLMAGTYGASSVANGQSPGPRPPAAMFAIEEAGPAARLRETMPGQTNSPRFMYIYRDSLKQGVDSAYRAIEEDAARICAELRCPNPYIAIEPLNGSHEVWWLNVFATEADTGRVSRAYAGDRPLMQALGEVARRKASLIGTPIEGYAVHRPDLSRGPAWSVAGARFIVIRITKEQLPTEGVAWMTADSTLYLMRPARSLREAEAAARATAGQVFAVRPGMSMPAPEWVAADPAFWRSAPAGRGREGTGGRTPDAAGEADPAVLAAENPYAPARDAFPLAGDFVAYLLSSHLAYHLGQLVAWRAAAGMGRLARPDTLAA